MVVGFRKGANVFFVFSYLGGCALFCFFCGFSNLCDSFVACLRFCGFRAVCDFLFFCLYFLLAMLT